MISALLMIGLGVLIVAVWLGFVVWAVRKGDNDLTFHVTWLGGCIVLCVVASLVGKGFERLEKWEDAHQQRSDK